MLFKFIVVENKKKNKKNKDSWKKAKQNTWMYKLIY